MGRIRLHVVTPTALRGATPPLDALNGVPLPQWFAQATGGELDLRVRAHEIDFDPNRCTSALLHDVAALVLPQSTDRPTEDVALIFASSWVMQSVQLFGLMFDFDGEEPALGVGMSSRAVPRQACAVFLDAFAGKSQGEIIHTAIHELGHVFNLQHDPQQASFMGDQTLQTGFVNNDRARLRAAAQRHWDFAPGGSNFGWYEFGRVRASGARAVRGLTLRAVPERKQYLLGEPVVLQLTLTVTGRQGVLVPQQLDPGHETLRIWYETPLGERRLFRSRNLFCRSGAPRRRLPPGASITNNPRISLGRSGPTLLYPGSYSVWAEFGGVPGRFARLVRSEAESFAVRSPRSDADIEISAVLRLPGMAACIIDKGGRLRARERRRLERVIRKYPTHPALQHARYALACQYRNTQRHQLASALLRGISLPRGQAAQAARRLQREVRGLSR